MNSCWGIAYDRDMDTRIANLVNLLAALLMAWPSGICCGFATAERSQNPHAEREADRANDSHLTKHLATQLHSSTPTTGKRCCRTKLDSHSSSATSASDGRSDSKSSCHRSDRSQNESDSRFGCCCEVRSATPSRSVSSVDERPVRSLNSGTVAKIPSVPTHTFWEVRIAASSTVPLTGTARQAILNVWRN